jgi:hypothetical protein
MYNDLKILLFLTVLTYLKSLHLMCNKSQLSEQAQLWRAISSVNVVQNIEMLKNFTKINHDEKVALLQKLLRKMCL